MSVERFNAVLERLGALPNERVFAGQTIQEGFVLLAELVERKVDAKLAELDAAAKR